MFERHDADRQHDAPRRDGLPVIEAQLIAAVGGAQRNQLLWFDARDVALLKGASVGDEGLELHRQARAMIAEPLLAAEILEREFRTRVEKVRRFAGRFEKHARRHMASPSLHRRAEHPMLDPRGVEVSPKGEAIGAGSDDRHVDFRVHPRFLPGAGRPISCSAPQPLFTVETRGQNSPPRRIASIGASVTARRRMFLFQVLNAVAS